MINFFSACLHCSCLLKPIITRQTWCQVERQRKREREVPSTNSFLISFYLLFFYIKLISIKLIDCLFKWLTVFGWRQIVTNEAFVCLFIFPFPFRFYFFFCFFFFVISSWFCGVPVVATSITPQQSQVKCGCKSSFMPFYVRFKSIFSRRAWKLNQ